MTNTNTTSGAADLIASAAISYLSSLMATRRQLEGFLALGNEVDRAADLDAQIEALTAALASAAAPAEQPAPSAAAAEPSAHAAWSAFERLASNQGPDTDDRDKADMVLIRDYLMRAARVGRYRAPQPSPTPQADSQPAPRVGTIAHVGTGKTTLTGAIASALRAAPVEQPDTAHAELPGPPNPYANQGSLAEAWRKGREGEYQRLCPRPGSDYMRAFNEGRASREQASDSQLAPLPAYPQLPTAVGVAHFSENELISANSLRYQAAHNDDGLFDEYNVEVFTADQMLAFADATYALRASSGQTPLGAKPKVVLELPEGDE